MTSSKTALNRLQSIQSHARSLTMSSSIPKTMRAVDIKNGKGPIEAMFVSQVSPYPPQSLNTISQINDQISVPTPTATQALVKIHCFGLNRMDLLQREGHYPLPPQAPATMGVEFSGTIVSFGKDPERGFNVGDEVFGLAYGGAYAEYIAVSTHMLMHKPSELSWEEAAGIPEVWITASQALWMVGGLDDAPGPKAKSVLWHAGASSVSIAGIQLCKAEGCKAIYVTASTQEKIEFCKKVGATEGWSYKDAEKPWDKQLLAYTEGKGADLIVDFVGAGYFSQNLDAAARDGRSVNLGGLGGTTLQGPVDIGRFLRKRVRYEGSSLRSRDEIYQGKLRDRLFEHAVPRFKTGEFKVHVEKVFKMGEIQEAHRLLQSSQTMGKLICTVD